MADRSLLCLSRPMRAMFLGRGRRRIRLRGSASRLARCAGLASLLAVGGCSGLSMGRPDTDAAKPVPSATPAVYFSAVGGLAVYGQPRASAPVQGHLSLHEKVYRDRVEGGYAHVRAEGDRVVGWVDNAKLIWRRPSPATSGSGGPPPAPAAPPPSPATSSVPLPSSTPPPAAEPPPAPDQGRSTPAIFDAY